MIGACQACRFWRDKNDEWAGKGECRRYPPLPSVKSGHHGDHGWPETIGRSWCGEFSAKVQSTSPTQADYHAGAA